MIHENKENSKIWSDMYEQINNKRVGAYITSKIYSDKSIVKREDKFVIICQNVRLRFLPIR